MWRRGVLLLCGVHDPYASALLQLGSAFALPERGTEAVAQSRAEKLAYPGHIVKSGGDRTLPDRCGPPGGTDRLLLTAVCPLA